MSGTTLIDAAVRYRSIPAAVLETAERIAESTALVAQGGQGERISYGQLAERVTTLAGGLKSLGIQPLDRVALLGENRPEWALSYLAIQNVSATVVPLDILLKPVEHLTLLRESSPKAIILSAKFYDALREHLGIDFPNVTVILMDETSADLASLPELYKSEPFSSDEIDPDQPASLIFTSGTTGKPKAVILTHRNICSNIEGIFSGLCFTEDDTFISVLPLSHVYECTAGFLTPLFCGAKIVYARSLAGPSLIADIRANEATILVGMPLLYDKMRRRMRRKINEAPALRRAMFGTLFALATLSKKFGVPLGRKFFGSLRAKAGLDSLRLMVSGGAPLDPAIGLFFENLGFNVIEGYGMTECSPIISLNRPGEAVIGSVGKALPGMEIRIDSPNAEGIGEILARGESVTPGYLNDEEKTNQILKDGWLITGDLGRLENGRLYICGRAKNLIVSAGGKNIYPEEIETKLLESDFIAEALVIGRKEEGKQGETVHAIIFPDAEELFSVIPDFNPEELSADSVKSKISAIVTAMNSQLGDYKRISSWEIITKEFEKTASKKIKRTLYK